MEPIAATSYLDAQTMQQLVSPATNASSQLTALDMGATGAATEVDEAVSQFRNIFLGFMVGAMRQTVPDGGLIPKNSAEKMFESFLDQEYAKALGEQMGDDMISQGLRRQLEPKGRKMADETAAIRERAREMALPPATAQEITQETTGKEEDVR